MVDYHAGTGDVTVVHAQHLRNHVKHRDLVIAAAIKAPVTLVLKPTPVAPVPSYGTASEGGHAQVESFPPG